MIGKKIEVKRIATPIMPTKTIAKVVELEVISEEGSVQSSVNQRPKPVKQFGRIRR